jgi:hypothetical protein
MEYAPFNVYLIIVVEYDTLKVIWSYQHFVNKKKTNFVIFVD